MSAVDEGSYPRMTPTPTLTDRVAKHVLDDILGRRLQPGEPLPSEREMGESFGVSRTVIREAVRSLVARGVIETRPGVGLRVAATDTSTVSEALRLYLHGVGGLDYRRVHEVRTMLEGQVAEVACEFGTDDDMLSIRHAHDRMGEHLDDPDLASVYDVEFHRQLAIATKNPLYVVMLDSVREVLLESRQAIVGLPGRASRAHDFHTRILNAVRERDATRARTAMVDHLDDVHLAWVQLAGKDGERRLGVHSQS